VIAAGGKMNTKYYGLVICFLAVSLLIAGCGPGQLLGPTLTPIPTPTPTPTPTPKPKEGVWKGDRVSFTLIGDKVRGLHVVGNQVFGSTYCVFDFDKDIPLADLLKGGDIITTT
jgi:hypothetical protein